MRAQLLLLALLTPLSALADKRELSVRPSGVYRLGAASTPVEETTTIPHFGGGVLVGYGLSFSWSLTARYEWSRTQPQNLPVDEAYRYLWVERQNQGLVGVAWTFSDELTPLMMLEAGAAHHATFGDHLFNGREGDRLVGAAPEVSGWSPVVRLTAAYEWRFKDYWSVAPGAFVGYDRALSYGALLAFSGYHYINPRMLKDRPFNPEIYSSSGRSSSKRGVISAPRFTETPR